MRSRSSSKHTSTKCMETERPKEPQLSGAYIRSLVKQLSSSRPKEQPPASAPTPDSPQFSPSPPPPPPPPPPQTQPPKKQVRRRLHTSRPYQERLLNMAEARREIVTALKFHRASMKQSSQQNHQNMRSTPSLQSPPHQEMNPNPSNIYQPYPSFCWAYPQILPLPMNDTLTLSLPNQPLGLNLNFQGFNNIDLPYTNNNNKATSSSTSYSSPSLPSMSPPPIAVDPNDAKLHPMMDDEEMKQIRSISEQHDMEWNDTMNLVTTAWWSQMLEGDEERGALFDEAADVPAWLLDETRGDPAISSLLPEYFEGYFQDEALPCLDIGDIEGLDGDWLS